MRLGQAIIHWQWAYQTRKCTAVIAPSAHVKTIMEAYGIKAPIHTFHNGIERELFTAAPAPLTKADLGIDPDQPTAVYSGRLANEKDVLSLLDAFAQAQTHVPNLHLLVIGNGQQKAEFQEKITDLGLQNHISLLGWLPFEQVGNYLAAADFFVTASKSEVHPLTIIEAAAAGLPIIAPETQWVRDALPETTAVLSSNDLTQSIITLAKDKALCQELSLAARKASEPYDIHHTVTQTIALYESALNR